MFRSHRQISGRFSRSALAINVNPFARSWNAWRSSSHRHTKEDVTYLNRLHESMGLSMCQRLDKFRRRNVKYIDHPMVTSTNSKLQEFRKNPLLDIMFRDRRADGKGPDRKGTIEFVDVETVPQVVKENRFPFDGQVGAPSKVI